MAAATMIVYAGATIIIFLFVLMFAQQTNLRAYDLKLTRPLFAAAVAAALVIAITWSVAGDGELLRAKGDASRSNSAATDSVSTTCLAPSNTAGLGRALSTDYLMAIELAGTVLLVATIGAIVLAQRPVEEKT
ncbi:MAG: NADH-quinone oxidoreductase subunit J [Planctomycetota bacterium]